MRKIIISALIAVGMAALAITFLAPADQPASMVIEDNGYVPGGYLPPDDYILGFGDGLDLEDDMGTKSPYYSDVKDLFYGYDEIVIINHVRENPDPTYNEPVTTYIFLTQEPFEYETLSSKFYYEMLGITIVITEKGQLAKYTTDTSKNNNDVYKTISGDLIGIGHNKFKGTTLDGMQFDLPTKLNFVDNEKDVSIKGFMTLDQVGWLKR